MWEPPEPNRWPHLTGSKKLNFLSSYHRELNSANDYVGFEEDPETKKGTQFGYHLDYNLVRL
jgi:hypothetical protein